MQGLSDLRQRDLRLGLKRGVAGDSRFCAPFRIVGPFLGQIKAVGDGKARMMVRNRQRNGDLAIVLLAGLAAILPRDPDGVLAFLRKTRVIDNKGFDGAVLFEDGKRQFPTLLKNTCIGPRRVAGADAAPRPATAP